MDQSESRLLAFAPNNQLLSPLTSLHGQAVLPSDFIIRFTRTGDATLTGVVDDNDVSLLGGFYNTSYDPVANGPRYPYHSDTNYDGIINDTEASVIGGYYNPNETPVDAQAQHQQQQQTAVFSNTFIKEEEQSGDSVLGELSDVL